MTEWCVERPREEGIYKSRKVMGIPRKVVQDFFFNREICLCCFCERTQTNLLRFLVSLSFRRLLPTDNMFRVPSVTGTLRGALSVRRWNFFSKNYVHIFSQANARQTSLCSDFHALSIFRLFIKSLGEEHVKSPFYWCSYCCTVCPRSQVTNTCNKIHCKLLYYLQNLQKVFEMRSFMVSAQFTTL
jgi:hypothetical protein